MRIAEIAPPWFTVPPSGYGGIELVVAELCDALARRGHDVTLFASGGSRTRARLVSPIPEPPAIGGPDGIAHESYHAMSAYLRADEFDVVHDHTWVGPALGALRGRPPVVTTLHGPPDALTRRHLSLLHRRVHLVAISRSQAAGYRGIRLAGVVHNGIDVSSYPFRQEKEDFLLFVGRSCADKGPDRAVEGAWRVGLPLVMVVKRLEDHERRYWDEMVAPVLTGSETVLDEVGREEQLGLFSRARALVFPIRWPEPFGLVMTEAMACGTPVLAHPFGAAIEVVEHGRTGFLCETPDDMVEAVAATSLIDPQACRERVAARFSTDAMVRGYEAVFERAVTAGAFDAGWEAGPSDGSKSPADRSDRRFAVGPGRT